MGKNFTDQFAAHDSYRVQIISKHIELTQGIKDHIIEKLHKLDKLSDQILDIHITLDVVNKIDHEAQIVMKFAHTVIKSSAHTTDLYVSIDKAVEKLQHKLRQWKTKIQKHHAKKPSIEEVKILQVQATDPTQEINDDIEEENAKEMAKEYSLPKIESDLTLPIKMLTSEEALMKMELSDDRFMLYRGEEDQKLKVIYRMENGNYGIVAPDRV